MKSYFSELLNEVLCLVDTNFIVLMDLNGLLNEVFCSIVCQLSLLKPRHECRQVPTNMSCCLSLLLTHNKITN